MNKTRKLVLMIFTLACLVAAITCIIVDLAINRHITWAAYPLLSIAFGWAVATPVLAKRHGVTLCLCSLSLLILPYLFFLSRITPVTDWFRPVGLPGAI